MPDFSFRPFKRAAKLLGLGAVLLVPVAGAQTGPTPSHEVASPKLEFYAGYGDIQPFASKIANYSFQSVHNLNATASASYYFRGNLGIQIEGAYFNGTDGSGAFNQCRVVHCSPDGGSPMYYSGEGGLVYRFPEGRWVPFVHALGGGVRVNGPYAQPLTWGYGLTGGGGADYVLPFFSHRFALRAQADYQYFHVDYGTIATNGQPGGVADVNALKLSAGLVLRLGAQPLPPPISLACNPVQPFVYPGDSLTVKAVAAGLDAWRNPVYTYATTGGAIFGSGEQAIVESKGLAPGTYTVTGTVTEGPKPGQTASCSTTFVVRPYDPPTLSCSAGPSSLTIGDTATIISRAVSPQNRPLTFSFASTSGRIIGSGPTVALATDDATPGNIAITCNVVDDLGNSATAKTSLEAQAPAPPPVVAAPVPPPPIIVVAPKPVPVKRHARHRRRTKKRAKRIHAPRSAF